MYKKSKKKMHATYKENNHKRGGRQEKFSLLLKTFAEFEIVFSRKMGLSGKSSHKLAEETISFSV